MIRISGQSSHDIPVRSALCLGMGPRLNGQLLPKQLIAAFSQLDAFDPSAPSLHALPHKSPIRHASSSTQGAHAAWLIVGSQSTDRHIVVFAYNSEFFSTLSKVYTVFHGFKTLAV